MSPSDRNRDRRAARAAVMALLWLVVSTPASGQVDPDQPRSGGIEIMTPGRTSTERTDIPGTSQEQQEAELAAQRAAGCSTKVLDPRTLALLEPYLNGLVAQSNYLSTHLGRTPHTPSTDAEWMTIYRQATRLEDSTAHLDKDKSPAMDRALAYLLRFRFLYGDFADDNIDCELAQRAGLTPRRRAAVRPTRRGSGSACRSPGASLIRTRWFCRWRKFARGSGSCPMLASAT